ncbi:unnamed protein product [Heligmosomoides polygyrus]|uniref:Peptidase A2 domain-containing protein n=1 Tax=Heligmosomoides polygyrus TaxID=6339 RepID=A0A3P8AV23_HELPZ|nr:unnamed protein product [Heligmosomoides polygyrus]
MAKILGEKDIVVRILLDTGAELSFIDTQIIKDLNHPVVGKSMLKIKTFGQTTVEEIQYPVAQVLLEDTLGKIHELRLYDSKTITSKAKRPVLKFVDGLKVKLPSKIYTISTLFGNMLSGSQSSQNNSTKERQVMCTSNLSEEAELWDTYWKMDSAGINEYPGPEKTEKQRCDEEVWRNFGDTTVKRSDGMAEDDLEKWVPVSDDEEEGDLLYFGDYQEGETEETSAYELEKEKESEEGEEADKSPTDEPEGQENEGKEQIVPLSRNDFANVSVRILKLINNIGVRQQLLLEELKEETEDRLGRIEKKLTTYQIKTEQMPAALMDQVYCEEAEPEAVDEQPTSCRRNPSDEGPPAKRKRDDLEVRVATSQLQSQAECPVPKTMPERGVPPTISDLLLLWGKSHHTALCTLPEERKQYEEILMRAPARH